MGESAQLDHMADKSRSYRECVFLCVCCVFSVSVCILSLSSSLSLALSVSETHKHGATHFLAL